MPHHPVPMQRRSFFAACGGVTAAAYLTPNALASLSLPSGLFGLGVASGDPMPDGVVIWTRLAPEPVSPDGHGGMPTETVEVDYEVATGPTFSTIVRRDTIAAKPRLAHSVHVELHGLRPATEYWYRFRSNGEISPVGRTKTAPARDSVAPIKFAFVSCSNYVVGHFTPYPYLADERPDLIVHLGDYIYEGGATGTFRPNQPEWPCKTLADYRIRYSLNKTDPDLQTVHAAAPFAAIPDDHEVRGNWYGTFDPPRIAAAWQAYYENLPFRRSSIPKGPAMQIFRRLEFGQVMSLNLLDCRQFRSPLPRNLDERWDADRTMLGAAQERWLLDGLRDATATWKVIGNQVVCMEADRPEPGPQYPLDKWSGYAAARQNLFQGLLDRDIENYVMITGDWHKGVAGDLKLHFDDMSSPTVGAEFVGTSITSGGDGLDFDDWGQGWLDENPYYQYFNNQRGYQMAYVTSEEMRVEYRIVDRVKQPTASLSTRARMWVEPGQPGIAQVDWPR